MTGAHNFFCLYAPFICDHPQLRGMSRTLPLCLQFPIVTTILCGQLAGKAMTVLPAVCYYTAQQSLSRSIKPLHFLRMWRQRENKNTAHYIPILLRGLGAAVVTNDWCSIYSLWCTLHEHLVLSHPKNILTPNTKYDIR